jgi:lipopolysaccharide/colanic/teichoic acid biosynthesis glycosyltransferase
MILLKTLFDKVAALLLLLIFCLPMLLIGLMLFIQFQGRVLFSQSRIGFQEKPFYIFKFRTMLNKFDSHNQLLPDNERLTILGKWLRKTSLDELPQLWNVLRGDMSFVGPRPLLPEYLPRYSQTQRKRHLVKPGITGWAQVNGRNSLDWQNRLAMDVWYVEHQSLSLDMKILWLTVLKFFKKADGDILSKKFEGNIEN